MSFVPKFPRVPLLIFLSTRSHRPGAYDITSSVLNPTTRRCHIWLFPPYKQTFDRLLIFKILTMTHLAASLKSPLALEDAT